MIIKKNKKAFSMVELMLLLLFVSLITAALTPVVTRKHYKIPKPSNHGAYLCYYNLTTNSLHEARFSGKSLQTVVFDRDVASCTFEPPQKVSYFHVSAIGGGGGGGDSGYSGGAYTTLGPYTEQLSPLGITSAMISENQRDITTNDLTNFGGKLYGYVNGAASGDGGDQQYISEHHSEPCTEWHSETYTKTFTDTTTSCTSHHYITECPEGSTCTSDKSYDSDSNSSTSSTSKGNYDSQSCSTTHSGGAIKTCIRQKKVCSPVESTSCVSHNGAYIGGKSGIGSAAQNRCIPVKTSKEVCTYECDEWQTNTGNQSGSSSCYNTPDSKLKMKLPNFKYYDPDKSIAFLPQKYAFLFSVDKQKLASWYVCDSYSTDVTTSTRSYQSKVCDTHRDYYYYSTTSYSGGSGQPGAVCRSAYTNGGLNLSLSEGTIQVDGYNGASCYNATPPSSQYDTPATYTECTPCPATDGQGFGSGSYSTITFNGSTVGAQDAPKGGTGATCSGNGTNGTAGTSCTGGSTVTEGCSPGRYGYCLLRHHRTSWEANASYEFKFTFSQNYLQYGEAGEQGQYRTMIIRSFKSSSNPITIGAGGVAGTNGGKGGTGSPTVFGNIITAKGGAGGDGGFMTPPEILTGYRTGATSWPAGDINQGFVSGSRVVRQEGGKAPETPKPNNLSANILNFLVPQDSEKITEIMEDNRIGYGGTGGGSRHNCWFGEYRKWLDEVGTCNSTSYPNTCGELEHSYKLPPESCTSNYERIDAEQGKYGGLIIRW